MESVLKSFLLPSSLVLLALGLGLIFLLRRRRRTVGVALLSLGALIYLAFGSGLMANWLVGGLERRYTAIADPGTAEVDYIVLLAHGGRDGRVSPGELMETMRLQQALPHATVLLSGWEEVPAQVRQSLLAMGMPPGRVILETGSRTLHDSAVHLGKPLKGERFLLVAPASGMARIMAAFEREQLEPIPAPTGFLSRERLSPTSWLPTPGQLAVSDLAVRERFDIAR